MLHRTLENGLKVVVEENRASPVVAAQVWVQVGSADEHPEEAGLAHVHEHMLFKGTARRGVGEIAADVEAAGGDINAFTSFDHTVYHVTIASRELDVALDILADAVQHSSFDADELDRELEVVLEELRRGQDTPSRVSSEMLFDAAYRVHPYRRPIIGYLDTVKSFTREQILGFYRKWYQPQNMCLVVVGDVQAEHVADLARKLFDASLNRARPTERRRAPEPCQDSLRTAIRPHDTQETHLGIAWHGTALRHEDTPALDVLSVILGAGESSRLFSRVKRDRELVNDCYAFSYTPQDMGLFVVGAQIHGGRVEEALRALMQETFRLRFELPDSAEVEKAKTIILSDAVYSKETVQGIARKRGYFELVGGGVDFEDRYYEQIRAVTAGDVRRVARQYLRPESGTVSALLPEAERAALSDRTAREAVEDVDRSLKTEYARERFEPGRLGVVRTTLENGAKLLVCPDSSVPLVSIRAAARGGLLAEDRRTNGVSYLTGELLVRGTDRYSAEQIIEESDAMAGSITGVSGRNSLGLRGDFLSGTWERGFELFASCLLEPSFPEAELEKERKTQLEDIVARQDSLSTIAFEQLAQGLFDGHPYGLPTLGTEQSVRRLTRFDVVQAFERQLSVDRLVLTVVGDVDVAATIRMVERRIGVARARAEQPFEIPAVTGLPPALRTLHTVRDRQQAHLVLGFRGLTLDDERQPALEVLSAVLSGQAGRLFLELRDRQSLAYSVGAFSTEGLCPGYFAVYIGTSPDKLETADRGIRRELQAVLDDDIDDEEVARAQRYLVGAHAISLQRAGARCSMMALNEAYGLGYAWHGEYADRIMRATPASVRQVATDVIRFDGAVRSVVSAEPPADSADSE